MSVTFGVVKEDVWVGVRWWRSEKARKLHILVALLPCLQIHFDVRRKGNGRSIEAIGQTPVSKANPVP
jgi:hypothetical protein